jgi:hypothetical protein
LQQKGALLNGSEERLFVESDKKDNFILAIFDATMYNKKYLYDIWIECCPVLYLPGIDNCFLGALIRIPR